jgi:nuclear pore complex protein Nup85
MNELMREAIVLGIAYTSLSLMQIIFIPSHGAYNAVVGRELLHWMNTNFLTTMEEEGTDLLKIDQPWLNPNFWTFIKRCVSRPSYPLFHFLHLSASVPTQSFASPSLHLTRLTSAN